MNQIIHHQPQDLTVRECGVDLYEYKQCTAIAIKKHNKNTNQSLMFTHNVQLDG